MTSTQHFSWRPPRYQPEGGELSPAELDELREEARQAGRDQGLAEGRAAAQAELATQLKAFDLAVEQLEADRDQLGKDHHQRMLEVLALSFRYLFFYELRTSTFSDALLKVAMQGLQLDSATEPTTPRLVVDTLTAQQLQASSDVQIPISTDPNIEGISIRLETPTQSWRSLPEQELLELLQEVQPEELRSSQESP